MCSVAKEILSPGGLAAIVPLMASDHLARRMSKRAPSESWGRGGAGRGEIEIWRSSSNTCGRGPSICHGNELLPIRGRDGNVEQRSEAIRAPVAGKHASRSFSASSKLRVGGPMEHRTVRASTAELVVTINAISDSP